MVATAIRGESILPMTSTVSAVFVEESTTH